MDFTDEAVRYLARQMGEETIGNRQELETHFLPLIRIVLRTGRGRPTLVRWLQQHLPRSTPGRFDDVRDTDRMASQMTRLLCGQLVQKMHRELVGTGTRDTIVER